MKIKFAQLLAVVVLAACSQKQPSEPATPEAATGPIYEIEQINGDLYRARSDNHYTVFLVTSEGTILSDPIKPAFAEWLKAELLSRFDSEVRYVLYSHHHWDHASGGAVFADTAEFVGHEKMIPALARPLPSSYALADERGNSDGAIQRDEAGGSLLTYFDDVDVDGDGNATGNEINRDIVSPTITYSESILIELGGKDVRMVFAGDHHSDDGSIVHFVDESAAFGVDWLNVGGFPRILYGANLDVWVDAVDLMASLGISYIVPGHGPVGSLEDLEAYGQMFRDMRSAIQEAQQAGKGKEEFLASLSLPAYSEWNNYETRVPALAGEAWDLAQP
jgi:glyoxylase-like metal-dependent hydrolase (beta-lactamase superfamily II)